MTQTPSQTPEEQTIHCLVHPGFDAFEHPEFEANIHLYIQEVAKTANDILLIVSDGERFDLEQMKQFALLDIIEAIAFYISVDVRGPDAGTYSETYAMHGLTETFYNWCREHVDVSELVALEAEFKALEARHKSMDFAEHIAQVTALNEREKELREQMDVAGFSYKALEEFGSINNRAMTSRKTLNRGRFFRIHQHAMKAIGPERVQEIFIRDGEQADVLPILPVLRYVSPGSDTVFPTPAADIPDDDSWGCEYNVSEAEQFGNAAQLRDQLTYELSVSRNKALADRQAKNVLKDMGVDVTSDTKFVFFGEYRDRCVNNVLHILNVRMSPVTGDKWYLAHDGFTLPRPENYISTAWG